MGSGAFANSSWLRHSGERQDQMENTVSPSGSQRETARAADQPKVGEFTIARAFNPMVSAAEGTFDFMSITMPSEDMEEAEQQGECVTMEIYRIVRGRFSRVEMDLLASTADQPHDPQTVAFWENVDEIIIEQAAYFGWRLYMSRVVLTRIAIWTDHGDPKDLRNIEKLKRFHEAINRYAKFKRGLERLPLIQPEWYQTRKNTLAEIKALRGKLAARFAMTKSNTTAEEVYAAIRTEVKGAPGAYPNIVANLTSFVDYLKRDGCALHMVTNQITPATILDGFLDYQTGTAEGKSRQIISRIGSQQRKR